MLTFESLRHANVARTKRWHSTGIAGWSLSDWAVAMAGEAGEICNVVKKLNRARDGMVGNTKSPDELRADLGAEIADTLIYLDLLAAASGISLAAVVTAKFNAVSERHGFPERLGDDVGKSAA
jgi:NTP pyrophosphatase (non-canonical NTP hydrolase)